MNHTATVEPKNSNEKKGWASEKDSRYLTEVFEEFCAQKNEKREVQLIHPSSVTSRASHSGAILPPLSLAYLGATLRKGGYPVNIIEGQGDGLLNIRQSKCGRYNIQGLTTEEILEQIKPETYIVGISLLFSYEWLVHRDLIQAIKARFNSL